MKKDLFAKSAITIKSTPGKVWQLITQEASLQKIMMGMKPISDWKVGSEIRWIGRHAEKPDDNARGIIEIMNPSEKLQFTFYYPGYGYPDSPEYYNTVSFTITDEGISTHVQVSQGDFSVFKDGGTYCSHSQEFWNAVLQTLKQIAEENT